MNRREKLESMLQADPHDTFLQYALAMQCLSDGDDKGGTERFEALLVDDPNYVPAYMQLALALEKNAEIERSREVLRRGIEVAHRTGDDHAEGEMRGFLEQFGG